VLLPRNRTPGVPVAEVAGAVPMTVTAPMLTAPYSDDVGARIPVTVPAA
jgi:hypothetical protein